MMTTVVTITIDAPCVNAANRLCDPTGGRAQRRPASHHDDPVGLAATGPSAQSREGLAAQLDVLQRGGQGDPLHVRPARRQELCGGVEAHLAELVREDCVGQRRALPRAARCADLHAGRAAARVREGVKVAQGAADGGSRVAFGDLEGQPHQGGVHLEGQRQEAPAHVEAAEHGAHVAAAAGVVGHGRVWHGRPRAHVLELLDRQVRDGAVHLVHALAPAVHAAQIVREGRRLRPP
mmetsp:Transcript_63676/g.197606  ORF Transcript_63676/g.197606 Transcript_63676/m.197606 type:complete len:236 (-) Transcript_63676:1013-1720(-)